MNVPMSNPETAPVATDLFPAEPIPPANTKGNKPMIKAKEVINIGRRRAIAALIADLDRLSP